MTKTKLCKLDLVWNLGHSKFTSVVGSTFGVQSEIKFSSGACNINNDKDTIIKKHMSGIHVKLSLHNFFGSLHTSSSENGATTNSRFSGVLDFSAEVS